MNEFIDGATYRVVLSDGVGMEYVKYSGNTGKFECDEYTFSSDFLSSADCNFTVELVDMGPAPTTSTSRPYANIDNILKLLGLTAYNGDLSNHINQVHWHLVDNYCIAEDADFDKHMGFYRKDCTDEQALRKAVKRIRRQNNQYEELHETRRQLEQRVKVLNEQVNEVYGALMSIGSFDVKQPDAYSQAKMISENIVYLENKVKELTEKYVEPVENMRKVFAESMGSAYQFKDRVEITDEDIERIKASFSRGKSADPYPELHEDSEFIPTPVGFKSHTDLPSREPIKSDGLSSSYYALMINGNSVETEDVIRDVFGNDFDFGNVFKCLVRMYGAKQGAGKAGASIEYDGNKIHYSINKITGKGNDRG